MTIAQNSAAVRLLAAVWTFLRDAGRQGVLGRFFHRLGQGFSCAVRGSGLCRFLWREGTIPRSWPDSVACRLFTAVINIPCALLQWIYRLGRRFWDGSLFCRLVAAVGGASFFFLGLLMLAMLVAPHAMWDNLYALFGALAVTVLFLLGAASRPKHRLELDRLGPYMTLYMGFICYGMAASLAETMSLRFFAFHITAFLIVLVTVSAVRKYEQLQLVVAMAVFGVALAALYGCYQGYIGVEVVASQQDLTVNAGMPGRVYSFFDNPNNFAEILVMLIPLDLALIATSKSWRGKLWAFIALLPCVAAIGLTYSRSGWIGLALAVIIFLGFQNWRFIPLIIVLGLLALPILPETIYNRILTIGNTQDSSTRNRFAIYEAAANLMKDYWYRGVGLGHEVMQEVFKQNYPTMFDGNYPIHTHNNYLQMWTETGILGLISYLALLLSQLKNGVKAFRQSTDRRVRTMLSAALAGFCGILVIGVAEYTWFYPRNMFIYFFLFGVIGACIKLAKTERQGSAA